MSIVAQLQANTQFGEVSAISPSYPTARTTSTGESTGGQTKTVGQSNDGSLYHVWTYFLRFNTGAIPLGSTILQAQMQLVAIVDGSGTNFDVQICKQDWSGQVPITSGNRETVYDACRVATLDAVWRNTLGMSINTPYISNDLDVTRINLGGFTYYSLRSSRYFSGSAPSVGGNEAVDFASPSYDANEDYRPTLVVEYEPPSRNFAVTGFIGL